MPSVLLYSLTEVAKACTRRGDAAGISDGIQRRLLLL